MITNIPKPIPALKIPPTTVQELKNELNNRVNKVSKLNFFIIVFYL